MQSDPIGLAGGINTYAYVGGNPIRFVYRLGLAPGDFFRTEAATAKDAADFIAAIPESRIYEASSTIYQKATGTDRYSYTQPRSDGNPVGVVVDGTVPRGTRMTGDYHNHIPVPPGGIVTLPDGRRVRIAEDGQNRFSTGDTALSDKTGNAAYMRGPNGKMNVYIPPKKGRNGNRSRGTNYNECED